jgi:hypothetical protein
MRTLILGIVLGVSALATPARLSAQTPFAALQRYDGRWLLHRSVRDTVGSNLTIVNVCSRVGAYFACDQSVNGSKSELLVFLPGDQPGHFVTQSLTPAGVANARGELEIDGERWTYRSRADRAGKITWYRTTNSFSGPDHIHYEQSESEDGEHWRVVGSGDEVRITGGS